MAVSDDEKRGAFGSARALLGKVVGRVVDAAIASTRPSTPIEETKARAEAVPHTPAAPAPPAPVVTRAPEDFVEDDPEKVVVVAVASGRDRVHMSWTLSERSLERARRVLGAEGELRARIIVVSPDASEVVTRSVREHPHVHTSGEWVITNVPAGALCAAAVGLVEDERFVSAGHAPVVRL